MNPLISIVVPTYNRIGDISDCLDSLMKSSYNNIEIIVVDNASTDGSAEFVQKLYPNIKLIRNNKNLGVTGGRNAGAKAAIGDFVLFIDHDVLVDKELIVQLLNILLSDNNIGMVGPVVYFYDAPKKIWAAGASVNLITGRATFNTDCQGSKPFDVQVLPSPFMVRKEVLECIGLFDDIFFATYEDTDFCVRMHENDLRVMCVPEAKAWHKISSNKEIQEMRLLDRLYYISRNRIIFLRKHTTFIYFIRFMLIFNQMYIVYYTYKSLRYKKLNAMREYWRGLLDGLKTSI